MATTQKKTEKKQSSPVKKFFSVFIIMIACFLTYVSAKEVITTVQLKQDIAKTQAEVEDLEVQREDLENQQRLFEDPEYVKRYARGKYMFTSDGETLYKFPEEGTTEGAE